MNTDKITPDAPKKGVQRASGLRAEFFAFLKNYSVIGMAIGIVVGGAVTKLVAALVGNLVMPILSLILPKGGWQTASIKLGSGDPIGYGVILAALLDFLVIALVVFLFAKFVLREEQVAKK